MLSVFSIRARDIGLVFTQCLYSLFMGGDFMLKLNGAILHQLFQVPLIGSQFLFDLLQAVTS